VVESCNNQPSERERVRERERRRRRRRKVAYLAPATNYYKMVVAA